IEECFTDSNKRKIYLITNKGSQLKRYFIYPARKIKEIINAESPDIIHVHTLFEAFKLKKHLNIPLIFTNHSSSYLKMYSNPFLRSLVLPVVLKKFALIISPSTELFSKTTSRNSVMVSNGVNIKRFNPEKRKNVRNDELIY